MRIVIAGSRTAGVVPLAACLTLLVQVKPTVLLRVGVGTPPGPLEKRIADSWRLYEWWIPDTRKHTGRKAVWYRDCDMIADADLVLCFYTVEEIGDDLSGTVGLVDKAMAMEVPVYAYAIQSPYLNLPVPGYKLPTIVRVGEHDPGDIWGSTLAGILP